MTDNFQKVIQLCLVKPWAQILLFAACVDSFIAAYILENFFDVLPCDLCIMQRYPFAIVMVLMLIAFALKFSDLRARQVMALAGLVLVVNAGIAVFHSGVELHWWEGTDGCGVNPLVFADDLAAMRNALLNAPTVRCDEINFTFLGMTIANWNIPWSLGMAFFAFASALFPAWKDKVFKD